MTNPLGIDDSFASLSIPLSRCEYGKLKRNITRRGCIEPIIVWDSMILDGHKRYTICQEKNVSFTTKEMTFSSKEDAVAWLCRERLKAEMPSPCMRRYLIGRLLRAERVIKRKERRKQRLAQKPEISAETGPEKRSMQENWTAVGVGKELSMHRDTVSNYGKESVMLDSVREREPRMFQALVAGEFQLTRTKLKQLYEGPDNELKKTYQELHTKAIKAEKAKQAYMRKREHREEKRGKMSEGAMRIQIVTGIKEMPKFDPDVDLSGLSMTIQMWSNVIRRAREKMYIRLASNGAKSQLSKSLVQIEQQIDDLLEDLKDE